jgi:hypothetical protein
LLNQEKEMSQIQEHEVRGASREQCVEGLALERIRDALRGLRFGAVTITVQDGIVVQVDRTEKVRLLR